MVFIEGVFIASYLKFSGPRVTLNPESSCFPHLVSTHKFVRQHPVLFSGELWHSVCVMCGSCGTLKSTNL